MAPTGTRTAIRIVFLFSRSLSSSSLLSGELLLSLSSLLSGDCVVEVADDDVNEVLVKEDVLVLEVFVESFIVVGVVELFVGEVVVVSDVAVVELVVVDDDVGVVDDIYNIPCC